MARTPGVEGEQAGWFVRTIYALTNRKLGRVVLPVKITAHHRRYWLPWARWQWDNRPPNL